MEEERKKRERWSEGEREKLKATTFVVHHLILAEAHKGQHSNRFP